MESIEITLKDGQVHRFRHEGRAGGSYTKRIEYRGAFVVVIDEWEGETAFPACDVRRVVATGHGYS